MNHPTLASQTPPHPPRRPVPVFSCPAAVLEPRPSWRKELSDAVGRLVSASRSPTTFSIWCREGVGYDAFNMPAELLYFFVVMPRGGARVASRLVQELEAQWGPCRHEGAHPFSGAERALCGCDDGTLVVYD